MRGKFRILRYLRVMTRRLAEVCAKLKRFQLTLHQKSLQERASSDAFMFKGKLDAL